MKLSPESQRRLNRIVEERRHYYPIGGNIQKKTVTIIQGPPAVGKTELVKRAVSLAVSKGLSATEVAPVYTTDPEDTRPYAEIVEPDFMIDQIRHRKLASWSQNLKTGELSGFPLDAFSAEHNFVIGTPQDDELLRRAGFKTPFTSMTVVTDPLIWSERLKKMRNNLSEEQYDILMDEALDLLYHGRETHFLQKIVSLPGEEDQAKIAETIIGLVTQKPSPHHREILYKRPYYGYNRAMFHIALRLDELDGIV